MKKIKLKKYLLAALACIAILSCVQDDDFSVPQSLGSEQNEALTDLLSGTTTLVSISELRAMYNSDPNGDGNNNDAIPFRVDTDIMIKGYVTSSDLTGNFYKEVYLQDSPQNPTAAIKVILSQVDSYNRFNKGREVYIKLNPTYADGASGGLYIGEERTGNEVITIGGGTESDQYGTTVTSLSKAQMDATMFRSEMTEDIVPLNVKFSQIASIHIGMFVQIDNVEFEDDLAGLRYFDPSEDYDTQRTLQSCSGFSYSNMNLETSSFSNFKNELLPVGNGSIAGIVAKTYDGSSLILALNTTDDVDFSSARCSLLDIDDFELLLEEDFEAYLDFDPISGDWTNYIEEGTRDWIARTTTDTGNPGSKIAQISAYNSGDASTVSWLITPAIDLDAQEFEFFDFESSNSYSDGSELELLISTDWDGTDAGVSSATWTALPATIVPDDTYYKDWVYSGLVDLSPYSGNAYIAFKYTANSGNTGTYEIDNIKVLVQN
tara:strand:+ start:4502 stop:5974 length:1473 start_codon:yes stop_codon:yes gene_type:complete